MKSDTTEYNKLLLILNSFDKNRFRVQIKLDGRPVPLNAETPEFEFRLMPQDEENIRWYLEEYLQYPEDPAPEIAGRIEARMKEIGGGLFKRIFQADEDTQNLWYDASKNINNTRVEILTGIKEATAIPWELICEPKSESPLALQAKTFVRTAAMATKPYILPETDSGPIRILLVICRPDKGEDVPFRSVASRLIRGLSEADMKAFQLDVLRPPSFESLAKKLHKAKDEGKPYHVVHFDGHGAFLDVKLLFEEWKDKTNEEIEKLLADMIRIDSQKFSPELIYPHQPREGQRGYLAFDNPQIEKNLRLVDGPELGKLLRECNVPVLVLNACRSAHAEAPEKPETAVEDAPTDIHTKIRTFGSLAQEVVDAGVSGVVAMRYNVYVYTAAQFVYDLYSALTGGHTLGEAVNFGRKQLKDNPLREVSYKQLPLEDWCVPIVYEVAPISLFPKQTGEKKLHKELKTDGQAMTGRGDLDPKLPKPPDVGFYGRDETLLALDRAFDNDKIVLLHAYAGSGKTATVAEFARWYSFTGGIDQSGRVLFTSFERHLPLVRGLDQFGQIFGKALEQSGIQWLALEDEQRKEIAIQVLKQVPVLWIWDNVEPVTGFPAGTKSVWTDDEQVELVDFLKAAKETKAKFLLTSRRDEQKWLGNLPTRVTLPPMLMQECLQLTRALAKKYSKDTAGIGDWRPLLRYTQGNPLTLTVVVGQALRKGLDSGEKIEEFIDKLRSGEEEFDDDESEGRSRSLGASLKYGFDDAFTEDERRILAVLHLFQGFVDVRALAIMANPEYDWHLAEMKGLKREKGIQILDRAVEIGLLTSLGGGYYTIHPALPWFFKNLFKKYYPDGSDSESESHAIKATRAYVESIGGLGSYYHSQYGEGNRDVIDALYAEETNLLHARRLARDYGWWGRVISAMQGLRALYGHTGRRAEWKRLVEEIVPDFVDPETDGPLPGREENWSLVTDYRVKLAFDERQFDKAEKLQSTCVKSDRKRVSAILKKPIDSLNDTQINIIETLAASLHNLGEIRREMGNKKCVKSYNESLEYYERIDDKSGAASCAFSFGHTYNDIPDLRNLDKAEKWYGRSLELRDKDDRLGRARCVGQLGSIAFARFEDAVEAKKPEKKCLDHLNGALTLYNEALDLTPSDAIFDLAVTHNQLGAFYNYTGETNKSKDHYTRAISIYDRIPNLFNAAMTRGNVAILLMNAGRFEDALLYAEAALENYKTFGDRAVKEIKETKKLIARIKKGL